VGKKLIIDFGNSLQKLALYEGKEMSVKQTFAGLTADQMSSWLAANGPFDGIILSSVAKDSPEFERILSGTAPLVILDENTPLPIKNLYETPATLGKDRLAAAVGVFALYPGKNVLSIDAGTCITYDFLTKNGEYLGGGISPGVRMRLRAMNAFTGKLPLVELREFHDLVGKNTEESILSGVIRGVTEEIKGLAGLYSEQYGEVITVITGGDQEFLHNNLKINIFAVPNLVLLGLNEILDYHDMER
jgi:type III pantothenate kinase